jgi:hypothetical protein
MHIDLTEEETTALARLLSSAIDGDRFPLPPRKVYAPPSKGRYHRRG